MKIKNILIVIILIAAAVGLSFIPKRNAVTPPPTNDSPDPSVISTVSYLCEEGKSFSASYKDDSASLVLSDGRSLDLSQTISGSGVRYGNGEITFSSKGDNAFIEENGNTTFINCVANSTLDDGSKEFHTFTDGSKTFSFDYGNDVMISGGGTGYTEQWMNEGKGLGLILAKVVLPRSFQPKTNFSEGTMKVSTSSDPDAIKECLNPPQGNNVPKSSASIGGVTFTTYTYGDAGAGNFYNTTSYRAIKNNQCYVIEYIIHSTNIGVYSPDQGIKEYDNVKVKKVFEDMVQSFTFLQ